jgi:small GTP-binding protein
MNSFVSNTPDPNPVPTVSPAYAFRELTRSDGVSVCLQLWDTAGQERFHSISSLFYRESDVAVVCFEAGSQASLKSVPGWVKRVRNEVPDCAVIFVGTKSDLLSFNQAVDVEATARGVLDVFQPKGCFVISAVTGIGIDRVFQTIVDLKTNKIMESSFEMRANQRATSMQNECC